MISSCWTPDRNELVGKLVRRFAFDFDAVSNAFRNHLQREGVDFKSEETAPAALRKVYASLDRKRPPRAVESAPLPGVRKENDEPGGEADRTLVDVSGGDWDSMGTGSQGKLNGYIMGNLHSSRSGSVTGEGYNNLPPPERSDQLGASDDCPSEREDVQHTSGSDEGEKSVTAPSSLPSTDESGWDFGRFLEEQRLKEIQHDDRKEKIFQKEDRHLACQRQSLKKRYLLDSEDFIGEDPLGLLDDTTAPAFQQEEGDIAGGLSPRQSHRQEEAEERLQGDDAHTSHQAAAGPVRLELGMDAEELDKILNELERESSLAGGGWAETNSELSRVLDELDAAASEPPANAVLLQDTRE
ncbi:hypothetical protein Esi_0099_0036 [Ectocarpus siliculosus]|uniref:Uncharacterized protein n=1 Tax=Ectocarpus siliculosus TaxID=2880 RepID=D8LU96_ECTSI|nr:hypothetical protein Esi_0099_0036 [Ectocarpus siliculosus]|eukprot:CBN75437.1 hypothetical protein Esi_0099_0036 [Ectocarpus siliculosus]